MSKQDQLKSQIEGLCESIPELTGVLLASSDGLPIAHSMTNDDDPARVTEHYDFQVVPMDRGKLARVRNPAPMP